MLRLGLCCRFLVEPIHFRQATARHVLGLDAGQRRAYLLATAHHNALTLGEAVRWCARRGVHAFRVPSQLLPLYTHPQAGYTLETLDPQGEVQAALVRAGEQARALDVRLSFHPDQFVVPGSASPAVASNSLAELEYQGLLARWIGAVQLTLHGGGAQGGKPAALDRLLRCLERLRPETRALVALENDDRVYTVRDLVGRCRDEGLPLVYDVHHHRCHPDGLGEEEATLLAAATWSGREPWVHLSSPAGSWQARDPRPHADHIDPADVPRGWLARDLTIDVEAKAKEQAVLRLQRWLGRRRRDAGGRSRTSDPLP